MIVLFLILYNRDLEKKITVRDEQLICNYPELISKFNLMLMSGMTIRSALKRISDSYISKNSYLYYELNRCIYEIEHGVSEAIAYRTLGNRINIPCYIKFASLLEQNLLKGNTELISLLTYESKQSILSKKNLLLRKGEAASTKLLLPMTLLFIVILLLIMIPAFIGIKY